MDRNSRHHNLYNNRKKLISSENSQQIEILHKIQYFAKFDNFIQILSQNTLFWVRIDRKSLFWVKLTGSDVIKTLKMTGKCLCLVKIEILPKFQFFAKFDNFIQILSQNTLFWARIDRKSLFWVKLTGSDVIITLILTGKSLFLVELKQFVILSKIKKNYNFSIFTHFWKLKLKNSVWIESTRSVWSD